VLDALSESEEKFRTIFEFSPYSTIVIDLSGNILACNQQFTRLHATSKGADAQVGRHVSEFFPEDQCPKLIASIESAIAGKKPRGPTEYTMLREDGTKFLAEARSTVILDKQGHPRALLAIAHDITERKRTEQALRESENRYETVVENAGEGIVVVQDERLQYFNPYVENVFGLTREEMALRPFIEFVHPEDREQVMDIHRRRFRGEEVPLFYELRVIDEYGNTRWVENNGILIEWNGRPATLNFLRDITEQKKTRVALLESEEKYRQLFETETDAIMIFDAETRRYIDINDAAIRLYGYSKDEFLNLTPYDISAERDATEISIKQTIEGFPALIPLRRHIKKDGTVFPVEISGSSFMLNGRKVIFGVIRDITDRSQAEQELEKQRYYLAKAQEMGEIGTWEFDVRANKLVWTEETYRIFGIAQGTDLAYETFLNSVYPGDKDYVDKKWTDALNGEPYDIEHRILVDGEPKWLREKADLEFDEKGSPVLAIGFAQDITDRKKAEQSLRDSEAFLQNVFDGIRDGISILDVDLNVVRVNKWIVEMHGAEAQLVGKKCYEVYHKRDSVCPWCPAVRAIQTGEVQTATVPVQFEESCEGWIELSAFPLRGADGPVAGVIEHVKDVTKRRRAEQEILEHQTKLKSLAAQLSRIEERERHRLATALHDQIGQSLVFSKLKLDELRTTSPSRDATDALEEVCNSLDEVIQQTRTLTFDLSSPILYELGFEAAVAEWLADEIKVKHGIETEFCDDGQEKPLDDDISALLFRNVRELLVNVVKHAQAKKVKVDVRREGMDIRVCVEDDGMGFDPFEIQSTAARSNKFGLFSIHERLEQLGGLIEIDSGPGRGARILMKAPLKREKLMG